MKIIRWTCCAIAAFFLLVMPAKAAEMPDSKLLDTDELKNSLTLCSKPVQLHVNKKQLMKKTKKAIAADDLKKLADVVGLGAAAAQALDRVLAISDKTSRELDLALAGGK